MGGRAGSPPSSWGRSGIGILSVLVLGAMSVAHCTCDVKGVDSLFFSPLGLRSLRTSLVGLEPERLLGVLLLLLVLLLSFRFDRKSLDELDLFGGDLVVPEC